MKNLKTALLSALLALVFAFNVSAQSAPKISDIDRIRLAEAFRLADFLDDKMWKDWSKTPFSVLLITPENEFLIRHSKPSGDFASIGYDSLLKSEVYFRKRTMNPAFLATFPFNGVPTVVVGQAENTMAKTSTRWVVTLLHEHFHQLQNSQPNYFGDVEALNLSGADKTGMWMLNYAFPYSEAEIKGQFNVLSRMLAEVLQTKQKREFSTKLKVYRAERDKLEKMLKPADYKYFSFQLWQEGIARYTEYRVAELAAQKFKPGKEFEALNDFKPFRQVADEAFENIIKELTTLELGNYQRVAFYPIGAGEGLLLDRANPNWKNGYFKDKFYLDKYFKTEN
jgi:hypothetical protein